MFTLTGAFATFEAGKLADFVMLDDDPTRVAREKTRDVGIRAMVIGREKMFGKW
jgi:predicted amidohydrolase YtcJ